MSEPMPHFWRIAALERMVDQPGFARQTLPQSRAHDKRLRMLRRARRNRITGVAVRGDGTDTLRAAYAHGSKAP